MKGAGSNRLARSDRVGAVAGPHPLYSLGREVSTCLKEVRVRLPPYFIRTSNACSDMGNFFSARSPRFASRASVSFGPDAR